MAEKTETLKLDYFQLRDSDGEEYGIVHTDAPSQVVDKWWKRYYNEIEMEDAEGFEYNGEDLSADGFCELLEFLGYSASRIYLEDIHP